MDEYVDVMETTLEEIEQEEPFTEEDYQEEAYKELTDYLRKKN